MFRYKTTFQQDNTLAFTYTIRIIYLRASNGFHITYILANQQFSIVLISLFVDTFGLKVKEKISPRIKH